MVEVLNPVRTLARHPLFQVMLAFQNNVEASFDMRGLTATPEPVDTASAKFDLWFSLSERRASDGTLQGINGVLEYATDLFERATMEVIPKRLVRLLEAAVAAPDTPINRIDILSPAERRTIVCAWNNTAYPLPQTPVTELFSAQVDKTPDSVAVVFDQDSLTYAQLDARANQLAHHLRALGVGPEIVVGLCVERSLNMVVGLLGILKAGGAYLPLDPDYPSERLAFMNKEAEPSLILTHSVFVAYLPIPKNVKCILIDREDTWIEAPASVTISSNAQNLAYVLFTSGSTGNPKAAANTHGGLYNRLAWMQHVYQLSPKDAVLQKTPFSFDVSVWEFFWPLIIGARLIIAPPGAHRDPAQLGAIIESQRVTTLHFVPSMLKAFLAPERAIQCKSVRRLICSGEALCLGCATKC